MRKKKLLTTILNKKSIPKNPTIYLQILNIIKMPSIFMF